MYKSLEELYEAHKREDPDVIIKLIRAYFSDCGRLFRKGMLTDEEFFLATHYELVYLDLWSRKNNIFVKRELLPTYHEELNKAWMDWKATGSVQVKPWMNDCIKQFGSMEKAVKWVFEVIDACKIPLCAFDTIPYEEEHPNLIWSLDHDSSEMILTRYCLDFSKLVRKPSPKGKNIQLHFDGGLVGNIIVEKEVVDDSNQRRFICKGTITDYIEKPQRIEITLSRDGSLEIRFNRKTTTPWKSTMWTTFDPIPHPKWASYDAARMAAALRRECEYKVLRLPYMLGMDESKDVTNVNSKPQIRASKIINMVDIKKVKEIKQPDDTLGGAII